MADRQTSKEDFCINSSKDGPKLYSPDKETAASDYDESWSRKVDKRERGEEITQDEEEAILPGAYVEEEE